ncbi:MAG: hypothetical protein PQJ46_09320 [Spirochaetales bacterium]|nr:hypothetical protein [Spirochaetales bacterium]
MIPMLLRVRIKNEETNFGFYLPLLLVYILLLPAYIIVAIIYAIMIAAGEKAKEARSYMKIAFYSPALLAAAKGTEIEVHSDDSDVIMFIK